MRHIKSLPDIPEVAKDLGLKRDSYNLRDLWEHEDLGSKESVEIALPPQGPRSTGPLKNDEQFCSSLSRHSLGKSYGRIHRRPRWRASAAHLSPALKPEKRHYPASPRLRQLVS